MFNSIHGELTNRLSETKAKILVADDEANNRKLIQQMLKEHYQLSFAVNGKEAVDICKKIKPDMLLLDIMMPEKDGFEVMDQLKSDPETTDVPIIFITAINEVEDEAKGFSLGCVDYITKPISKPILLARVNTQLTIARQTKELAKMNKSLEKQNQELEKLQTLRDGLTHMIVHDMRSPLMAITASLELLKMKGLPEATNKYISNASTSAIKIINMVAILLDINKMEAGQMKLERLTFNLVNIVNQTIEMFEALKGERKLYLTSSQERVSITADMNIIQRVCQNLIDNAIKFTDSITGEIRVNIESVNSDKVRVSVSDNGNGIPSEYQEKIFDKFFQVEIRKKSRVHSTGLGMTFCKLAIEASGGCIGLESKIDIGTTFWFELPLYCNRT